jgi:hypothetical protein
MRPYLEKSLHQKRAGTVTHSVGPEFKHFVAWISILLLKHGLGYERMKKVDVVLQIWIQVTLFFTILSLESHE